MTGTEITAEETGHSLLRRGIGVLGVAVREEPRVFAAAVTGSSLYAAMTVASAWAIGRATSKVVIPDLQNGHTQTGALWLAGVLIFAIALLKATGIIGRRMLAGITQFRLQATYRHRVTRKYLELPLSWHQRHPAGELLSNANSDVESAWFPIAPLPMSCGVILMLLIALADMFSTDVVLAMVGLLLFPAVIVVNYVYERRAGPRVARAQGHRADVTAVAHESFDGALVVKTLGREEYETERFEAKAAALRDANISAGRARSFFDPALEALPNLGVLAILLLGTVRVSNGDLKPGDVVHMAYLITLLAWPLRAIGWVLGDLPRSVVGFERVKRVLDAEGELEYGNDEMTGTGAAALKLDDVTFTYTGASDPVLHDVGFTVPVGKTIALVGPTGAGKSTVTMLLSRLVDPDAGAVSIDGVELPRFRRGVLPDAVALVQQQTFVFGDTVRANVTLGDPGDHRWDDEQVWAALRRAQAERFVKELPDGLDTVIGERGATLSGGQRQRLALARALIRRPRLLVLDDATSAVDPRVEAAILSGLREAQRDQELGSTVLVVAYRRATIELADEVLYLERGRILDQGNHAELYDRCTGYRDLVTAYERDRAEREGAR